MTRRMIEWCVLAYPRARRADDGRYLRDLALELGTSNGIWREALSLLAGGVRERWRIRRGRGLRANARLAGGVLVTAALLVCGLAFFGSTDTDIEAQSCVEGPAGSCAGMEQLVKARESDGWECATRRHVVDGHSVLDVECRRSA